MNSQLLKTLILFISFALASCSTTKKVNRDTSVIGLTLDTSTILSNGFTGLHISDLNSGQVLFSRNAQKYFSPASNTKIFTLFACLKSLGDSIQALKYVETDSTLTFWGTGDPTFMHSMFAQSGTLEFMKSKAATKKIYQSYAHSSIDPYGQGWMWDDYNGYYQPELASFPAYGNVLYIQKDSMGIKAQPDFLMNRLVKNENTKIVKRNLDYNLFQVPVALDTAANFMQEIPYKNAESVNREILESLINTRISISNQPLPDEARVLYSLHVDTVLRRMMQVSDNMLAEHLLLLSGMVNADTISSNFAIQYTIDNHLNDLSQKPKWVDGSGLSRYNLMTPLSITELLKKMYTQFPEKRLFSLMSVGGVNGTIKGLYKSENEPYLFAKSGTLSGVYNLSGYLIAKSGRKLIFSFMNNSFIHPASKVRKEVERTLMMVRESY